MIFEVPISSMFTDAGRATARRRRSSATLDMIGIILAAPLLSFFSFTNFPDHVTGLMKTELTAYNLVFGWLRLARSDGRGPPLPQLVTDTEPFRVFVQIWRRRLSGFFSGVPLLSSEASFNPVNHRKPSCHLCSYSGGPYRRSPLEIQAALSSLLVWELADMHTSSDSHRHLKVSSPADLGQIPLVCPMQNWCWAWPIKVIMLDLLGPICFMDKLNLDQHKDFWSMPLFVSRIIQRTAPTSTTNAKCPVETTKDFDLTSRYTVEGVVRGSLFLCSSSVAAQIILDRIASLF